MSFSHPRWALRLLALTAFLLLVALAPAQSSRAQSRIAATTTPDWTAPHVPGQLLVKFSDRAAAGAAAATLAAQTGLGVQDTIPQLGIAIVGTSEAATSAELTATAAALQASPAVEWVEPNYTFTLDATPNDTYYTTQAPYLSRLEMPAAWEYTTGQPGVIIAVLDTGVALDHPDLATGIWTNPQEDAENSANGIDDDGNGFVDDVHGWNFALNNNVVADDYGHGTHVAGIAAARINNTIGIAGMAGGATIMPLKVFFPPPNVLGTYEDLIRAIVYATDNGARVINMSLGATSYSLGEEAAVDYAWNHGVVVVAAAGNTGRETYHYPAAHRNAIAVAATTASDSRASFSTYGDFVDVGAPGSGVYSTLMGGGYGSMSGTSMATPHVAGLATLLFSLNPQLTNTQVRELIEANVDDIGAAGWDPYFGSGRINARKALAAVAPSPQPSPTPTPHPPLSEWPSGCLDLIADGDFETGLGSWQAGGAWTVDTTRAYTGAGAMLFKGGTNATGTLTRTLRLAPATTAGALPKEATLWFAFRIENQDTGWGSSPEAPYDDWLSAEFRATDGSLVTSLLRTGNSADTATDGLPWDRYLYRMQSADLVPLSALGTVDLVFTAGNDSDSQSTSFWIDGVRLCVSPPPYRYFLPIWLQ